MGGVIVVCCLGFLNDNIVWAQGCTCSAGSWRVESSGCLTCTACGYPLIGNDGTCNEASHPHIPDVECSYSPSLYQGANCFNGECLPFGPKNGPGTCTTVCWHEDGIPHTPVDFDMMCNYGPNQEVGGNCDGYMCTRTLTVTKDECSSGKYAACIETNTSLYCLGCYTSAPTSCSLSSSVYCECVPEFPPYTPAVFTIFPAIGYYWRRWRGKTKKG